MKIWLIAIGAAGCLATPSFAQPSGRFVQAELLKTIKAKTAKAGDPVKARAVTGVSLPGGVAVPEGAILFGEVRSADPNSVSISFEQVEISGKKTPLSLSIRAAMMPGGPQKSSGDGGSSSLDVATPNAHPIKGGTAPLPEKTQNASQNASASPSEVTQPGRAVAAEAGSVIGMPGVTLQVDDSPQHASKFASSGKELQLKSGLQLMLGVPQ